MKHHHRGCVIFEADGGWVWEDPEYGAESDDAFETVEDTKANINLYYSDLDEENDPETCRSSRY